MRWITAQNLDLWANTQEARTTLPALVADLVRAVAPDMGAFRFPSRAKGQVRGFDGWLISDGGFPPYVPDGASVWEFGTEPDYAGKADREYKKLVEKISPTERLETAFVFVTPRTWNLSGTTLQEWIAGKAALNEWREINFLDGVQFEHWLDDAPAVAAKYAREELRLVPPVGARSVGEFWNEYASRFDPPLTEDVLLCEREPQATKLIESLSSGSGTIRLTADSPDEVVAFVIAAVRKAEGELRSALEARMLVVDDANAGRTLSSRNNLVFLPRSQATSVSGLLKSHARAIISSGRRDPDHSAEVLDRPSVHEFAKALESMGFDDAEARDLARQSGRSVTILARQRPGGNKERPEWELSSQLLLPAMLAGAWNTKVAEDLSILETLTPDGDYDGLERELRRLARLEDPPVDREGSVWAVRSSVDLFVHAAHLLTKSDLERFSKALVNVFTYQPPPPDPDDPFGVYRAPKRHSEWLRDGLANTLLQVATLSKQAGLQITGIDPQKWVDDLVGGLPGLHNDSRMIQSLENQLGMLAEAAPRPLLSALEQMLEGSGEKIRPIFDEREDFLAPHSPHTNVLWALETLAWDPEFLTRVCLILAGLARVDPGGRLSNRPINSLISILLLWSPNTNARHEDRLAAVDAVIKFDETVGWELTSQLLPGVRSTSSPTSKPRFREAGRSNSEVLTYGIVWKTGDEIIGRALQLAPGDHARIQFVIDHFTSWAPQQRDAALNVVRDWLESAPLGERVHVWESLQRVYQKHLRFSEAEWALRGGDLEPLRNLIEAYRPADPFGETAWLFNDWLPFVGGLDDDEEETLSSKRTRALKDIVAEGGASYLWEFALHVKLPGILSDSLRHAALPLSVLKEVVAGHGKEISSSAFIVVLQALAIICQRDKRWKSWFKGLVKRERWPDERTGRLIAALPASRSLWRFLAQFGPGVRDEYWKLANPYLSDLDTASFLYAVKKLLHAGRASAALNAAYRRLNDMPAQLIFRMLDLLIEEINSGQPLDGSSTGYLVEKVFDHLQDRDGVPVEGIAKREYAYGHLFKYSKRQLSLHKLLATNPSFYVSVLKEVFKPKEQDGSHAENDAAGGTDAEQTQRKQRWEIAYSLLRNFATVPGEQAGVVDAQVLMSWVSQVRELSAEGYREVADIYIGHLLAHSPETDGNRWPQESINQVIEAVASNDLDSGVETERFNMRGTFSKAVYEGGRQERDLAEKYKIWSEKAASAPRVRALLQRLAEGYERDAEREDERARLDKLRR